FAPHWSPDGLEIAFHSIRTGNRDIYTVSANGANEQSVLATPTEERWPIWSHDGNRIYFNVGRPGSGLVRRAGRGSKWSAPELLPRDRTGFFPSPDGSRGLYRDEVAQRIMVTDSAGNNPIPLVPKEYVVNTGDAGWSPDSKTVYFSARERDRTFSIYAAPARGGIPVRVAHFTDKKMRPFRDRFSVGKAEFFITIGTRESDIWIMELKKQ
ncbi:MAG: hypothetical protein ABIS03_13675, partial [Gemmatimonadaceae bacterium]